MKKIKKHCQLEQAGGFVSLWFSWCSQTNLPFLICLVEQYLIEVSAADAYIRK